MGPTTPGPSLEFEEVLLRTNEFVVGLDEVGRGAVAGPLLVGAVAINTLIEPPPGLNDSKKLSPRKRESLVGPIQQWAAGWAVGAASAQEIDEWGLSRALALAGHRAIGGLVMVPTAAIVDGPVDFLRPRTRLDDRYSENERFEALPTQITCLIRGDSRSATVAAASILAKVLRDQLMEQLSIEFAEFGLAGNKGYMSAQHAQALEEYGQSPIHRTSWAIPGDKSKFRPLERFEHQLNVWP